MTITTSNGWIVGDANPVPEEGLYTTEHNSETKILMPTRIIIEQAFFSKEGALDRCKLLRLACANYARSKWGPAKKERPWQPSAPAFDPVRTSIQHLLSNSFWDRIDVVGSLVHMRLLRQEAATTVDLVVRFANTGDLGLLAIWNGPDERIHAKAPWAEIGAGVAAMSDSGIILERTGIIWASEEGIKLEAKPADESLQLWVDACYFARAEIKSKILK